MQPDLMRDIRKSLGWTLAQMAEQLEMSETYVGQMERGQKPIERRTALAVRQLQNEQSPIYGGRDDAPEMPGDVALSDAVLYWEPLKPDLPPVLVASRTPRPVPYDCSFGADSSDWKVLDNVGRLLRLFSRFHELTVAHEIAPSDVHAALLSIPEYRRAVEMGTVPLEMRPE